MTNFTSIGFYASSEEEISELIKLVIGKGTDRKIDKNRAYRVIKDSSGACLYLQGTKQHGVVGLNPLFEGSAIVDVAIVESLERVQETLDGAYFVWVNPNEQLDGGTFPTAIDIPNFHEQIINEFPVRAQINITGFPDPNVQIFNNGTVFQESQEGVKLSSRSFISQGMFSFNGGENKFIDAMGLLSAEITHSSTLQNKMTGHYFQHLKGLTTDCEMDFVFPDSEKNRAITPGNVISGSFWLSGRLVSFDKTKKKSLFSKIFK